MKRLLFISALVICWICCPHWVEGQNRTVYGKLTLFNTYPVRNLEVAAKKAQTVAVTDSSGWFALECAEKDIIMIRSEVFSPVNLRLNERTDTLLLNLIFLDQGDNRELATGFGYIRQEDLTFAMNHLGYQNNDFCNYNSIYDLIEGRFPGVIVESNGNDGAIYIRGSRSAGASNAALTVVDGIITGGIGWINPCDVKSINIMKDGMTAMYGSDGANGVVVIETHRGATR